MASDNPEQPNRVTLRVPMSAVDVLELRDQIGQVFTLANIKWSKASGEAELEFDIRDGLMLLQQLSGEYFDKEKP